MQVGATLGTVSFPMVRGLSWAAELETSKKRYDSALKEGSCKSIRGRLKGIKERKAISRGEKKPATIRTT